MSDKSTLFSFNIIIINIKYVKPKREKKEIEKCGSMQTPTYQALDFLALLFMEIKYERQRVFLEGLGGKSLHPGSRIIQIPFLSPLCLSLLFFPFLHYSSLSK